MKGANVSESLLSGTLCVVGKRDGWDVASWYYYKEEEGGGMYQHIASWFQGIEEAGGLRHVVVNTSAGGGLREGG